MISKAEKESLKAIIADTITLLCKNGLNAKFSQNFCIDGLIGITLDEEELMLVSIKETVQNPNPPPPPPESSSDADSVAEENSKAGSAKKRRRKRRHSKESDTSDMSRLDTPSGTPAKRGLYSSGHGDPNGSFYSQSNDGDNYNLTLQDIKHDESDDDLIEIIKEEPGLTLPDASGSRPPHIVSIQSMPPAGPSQPLPSFGMQPHMGMPSPAGMPHPAAMPPGPGMPPMQMPLEAGNYDDLMSEVELLPGSGVYIKKSTYNQLQFIDKGSKLVRKLVREIFPDVHLLASSSCMGKGESSSGLDRHKVEVIKDSEKKETAPFGTHRLTNVGSRVVDGTFDDDDESSSSGKSSKGQNENVEDTITSVDFREDESEISQIHETETISPGETYELVAPMASSELFLQYDEPGCSNPAGTAITKIEEIEVFECTTCGHQFKHPGALRRHKCRVLGQEREGKVCEECGCQLTSLEDLRRHKESAHGISDQKLSKVDDKLPMQCPICQKVLRSPYYYQEHLQKHNSGPTCECERCGASFKFSSSLRRHVKVCLDLGQRLQHIACDTCGELLSNAHSWQMHHQEIHNEDRSIYSCDYENCSKSFIRRAALRGHVLMSHTSIAETKSGLSCPECKKMFPSAYHLKEHLLSHAKGNKAECEHCGRQFRHPRSLRAHMQCCPGLIGQATKDFECSECGRGFRTKSLLQQHVLGKHTESSHGICDLCGREFTWRTSYLNHIKSCKGNLKDKKVSPVKLEDELPQQLPDESMPFSVSESALVNFPEDIGEEVVVVPIPYEGAPEEYIYTTEESGDVHEDVGATQEIIAEIVPEEQFYFQEGLPDGLQSITYITDQGSHFLVSNEQSVKGEFDSDLV